MTEKDAIRMAKEGTEPAWNEGVFAFLPGRYYHTMFFVRLPPGVEFGPHGGDTSGLLWRFNATPEDWILTFRFRYYNSTGNPSDPKDRKSWRVMTFKGNEAKAEESIAGICSTLSGLATVLGGGASPWQRLVIKGEVDAWARLVEQGLPSWLHQTVKMKVVNPKRKP